MNWRILMASLALAAFVAGCSKDKHADHDHDHGAHEAVSTEGAEHHGDEAEDAFADLSKEDAELARQQEVCPVSGEALGEMGTPVKVTAAGRTVFLCCKQCRKKFLADPQTYIAKIDARKKK